MEEAENETKAKRKLFSNSHGSAPSKKPPGPDADGIVSLTGKARAACGCSGPMFSSQSIVRLQGPNVWSVQTDVRQSSDFTHPSPRAHGYLQNLDSGVRSRFVLRDRIYGGDFPQDLRPARIAL